MSSLLFAELLLAAVSVVGAHTPAPAPASLHRGLGVSHLERRAWAADGPAAGNAWGYISVTDFGAVGDGATDDTAAFQSALDQAGSSGGGGVFVPARTFCIRGTLVVPAATVLRGANEFPFRSWGTADTVAGTTLLAFASARNASGPAFVFLNGADAGIQGLSVFYPEQLPNATAPTAYPPTVMGSGDNVAVQNVLLVNPYIGIDFATYPCGRHLINGVYGQPLSVGVKVDQCYDIGRIREVHFWPFWAGLGTGACNWQHLNAVSLDLMRTDWEIVEDVFSFGYHVGIRFSQSKAGSCNGQFTDINFDDVDIGVDATDTQRPAVVFSNLNIANAGDGRTRVGILGRPGGNAQVIVRGGSFWGELKQAVQWDNAGSVRLTDSTVQAWDNASAAVEIMSGRGYVQGSFFQDATGVAVLISAGADRAMVTGNELAGNTIEDQGQLTLVANNHA